MKNELDLSHYTTSRFNPIQDKDNPTSFSSITSANVGIIPQNLSDF